MGENRKHKNNKTSFIQIINEVPFIESLHNYSGIIYFFKDLSWSRPIEMKRTYGDRQMDGRSTHLVNNG